MTWWQVAAEAVGGYVALVAVAAAAIQVRRAIWRKRHPRPLPPLRRNIPGLPVDGPALSPHELTRFWLTVAALRVGAEAEDPMEGRKP